jgi:hypothetical protein
MKFKYQVILIFIGMITFCVLLSLWSMPKFPLVIVRINMDGWGNTIYTCKDANGNHTTLEISKDAFFKGKLYNIGDTINK